MGANAKQAVIEAAPLLQIQNLSISFSMYEASSKGFLSSDHIEMQVVRDLNLQVGIGEVVAIVGASGSGKTLLADSIFGLFDHNETATGEILFEGKLMDCAGLVGLRGHEIALVPQSVANLDPLMKVGVQVRGISHGKAQKEERIARQKELFAQYNLDERVENMYPHELSGGMARRVLLCCALMEKPKLIVADEPTPGLDKALAVQAMDDLRLFADGGGAVLLITHDIDLALYTADRILVFRAGSIVEEATPAQFADPDFLQDDFTKSIWRAMPEHGFHENMAQEKGMRNA